jgi:hypothetical protein
MQNRKPQQQQPQQQQQQQQKQLQLQQLRTTDGVVCNAPVWCLESLLKGGLSLYSPSSSRRWFSGNREVSKVEVSKVGHGDALNEAKSNGQTTSAPSRPLDSCPPRVVCAAMETFLKETCREVNMTRSYLHLHLALGKRF